MPPKKACDICYKRKIQCSIPSPDAPCNWCSHHDLQCTFNRQTPKGPRSRATVSDVKVLLRRIEQLERALTVHKNAEANKIIQDCPVSTTPTPDIGSSRRHLELIPLITSPGAPDSPTSYKDVPKRAITPSSNVLGHHWYYRGMPILSEKGQAWITYKSDQVKVIGSPHLFGSTAGPFLPRPSEISLDNFDLPNELPHEEATRQVLKCFLLSHSRLLFPIVDRHLFERTISIAYRNTQEPTSTSLVSAAICILSLHAMASRLRSVRKLPCSVYGEKCANVAQTLLPQITGEATVENLQTVLMLQDYRRANGQWQNANLLHSIACRMVCELEGHVQRSTSSFSTENPESERQISHIRRLFWISYIRDKDISLRSGLPPLMTGNYCNLACPENYSGYYDYLLRLNFEKATLKALDNVLDPVFPGDVRLSKIKEEACRRLYSPKATEVNDAELLLRVRQLDDQLENWRLSVPLEFRPRLSIPSDRPFQRDKTRFLPNVFGIQLQLDYHYTLMTIHATVRRCGSEYSETESLPENLHGVLHSSIDLLLEASRSTLILLRFSIDLLEEDAFWDIVFYSPVAVMSLFLDILIHPNSDHAQSDITVLATAMNTIQTIPADKISPDEAEHIQEIVDLIMEAVRLGGRAIWKAKRNKQSNME